MSKTSGISSKCASAGTFSWHWEFLLPTNARLVIFDTGERTITKSVTGTLPSSKIYAEAFNSGADFGYDITAEFTAHITAEEVLRLCILGTITDDASLADYIDKRAQNMTEKAAAILLKDGDENAALSLKDIGEESGMFSEMHLVRVHLPDEALYETLKAGYIRRIKEKEERTEAMRQAVSVLLSQYPELKVTGEGMDLLPPAAMTQGILQDKAKGSITEETKMKDDGKTLRSIRGATGAGDDSEQSIEERVKELCGALFKQNAIKTDDIISLVFTVTNDIKSINPATALRRAGILEGVDTSKITLFCAQEPQIDGMMPLAIRVMLTSYVDDGLSVKNIYIHGAETLRPDTKAQ